MSVPVRKFPWEWKNGVGRGETAVFLTDKFRNYRHRGGFDRLTV